MCPTDPNRNQDFYDWIDPLHRQDVVDGKVNTADASDLNIYIGAYVYANGATVAQGSAAVKDTFGESATLVGITNRKPDPENEQFPFRGTTFHYVKED